MMAANRFDQRLVILFVGGLLLILSINFTTLHHSKKLAQTAALQVPLQQAQDYLQQYATQHQQLPCADGNGDGYSDVMKQHCQYRLGWLPERTLKKPGLRDEYGEKFWYAVADDAQHLLSINGQAVASAVLLSAGPALDTQATRRDALADPINTVLQPELFLEGINAQPPWQQFSSLGSLHSNDQLLWITPTAWQTSL
jgi:hypothetical protein